MKKQFFTIMACATFFTLPSSFCMEPEEDKHQSVAQRVLTNPEISVKILGYVSFRRPLYFYSLGFGSKSDAMPLYKLVSFVLENKLLTASFIRERFWCPELEQIFEIDVDAMDQFLYKIDSEDQSIPDVESLKIIQLVSSQFCEFSRFHITSITTPSWANDDNLQEYSETLPNLKKLNIKETIIWGPENSRGIRQGSPIKPNITDEGLKKLTMLTELRLGNSVGITDSGIKNLTNLTSLDLENNWDITDDGLINESFYPRHPNLKLLLLPNEHKKITEAAMKILESHEVTVKENEYSIPSFEDSEGGY